MDRTEEARRMIKMYEKTSSNLEFTLFIEGIKNNDPELYGIVLRELDTGNYKVKYLNTTGTSF